MHRPATVDEYVSDVPEAARPVFEEIRRTVHEMAPGVAERISYGIPTFTLGGGDPVYLAAWKRYISVYPVGVLDDPLDQELAPYRAAKATVRFPLDRPVPYALIGRVVSLRLRRGRAGEGDPR